MNCALVKDEAWGVGLARLLLEKGASLKPRDRRGLNALHYAIIYERAQLVDLYLASIDFDLNQKDRLGNTALHYCASTGNLKITQNVLKSMVKYKMCVDIRNAAGLTPLLQAWKSGNSECACAIIELGNADQDICDPIEHKSARDWAIEAFAKANSASRESLETVKSQESCEMERVPRFMRPTGSARERRPLVRAKSAPPGGRSGRTSSMSRDSYNSNQSSTITNRSSNISGSQITLVLKEDITEKLYQDAGRHNPRNIPQFVFRTTPSRCFEDSPRTSPAGHNNILSPSNTSRNPIAADNFQYNGWQAEIKDLLNSYDFQWTESYRKSVIPKSVEQLTGEEQDEIFDIFPPGDPSESDGMSIVSDRTTTSMSSRRSSKRINSLKGYAQFTNAFDMNGKIAPSRRGSVLSMGKPMRRNSGLGSSGPPSTTSSEGSSSRRKVKVK